jgi:hypothetical protein
MNMTTLEKRLFITTNAVFLAGGSWCLVFFILDVSGVVWSEDVFSVGSDLATIGMIICACFAWYVTYQYFMRRANVRASGADYILLLVAACIPWLAIYVIRKIRSHEAAEENSFRFEVRQK